LFAKSARAKHLPANLRITTTLKHTFPYNLLLLGGFSKKKIISFANWCYAIEDHCGEEEKP
jgi:hypothetical protein